MSLVNVRKYFEEYGYEDKILEFDDSSATVNEAAKRLNTIEDRIAKSMSFKLKDDTVLVIVVSGNSRIDNRKFKDLFHEKAHMLSFEEVEELTTHPVGGVCPFALPEGVKVYLDESLKKYETVFPACGSTNSAIELTIEELEKLSKFDEWIDVVQ